MISRESFLSFSVMVPSEEEQNLDAERWVWSMTRSLWPPAFRNVMATDYMRLVHSVIIAALCGFLPFIVYLKLVEGTESILLAFLGLPAVVWCGWQPGRRHWLRSTGNSKADTRRGITILLLGILLALFGLVTIIFWGFASMPR
jgi:hypothetical protein